MMQIAGVSKLSAFRLFRKVFLLSLVLGGASWNLFSQSFVHPGCLETQADFNRMKAKVQAGAHPWIDSWNILIANSHSSASYTPSPVGVLVRGTGNSACSAENYSHAFNDAAAAYQLALRWKISGDARFANAATNVLNQWANTCTNICGDSNAKLAAGLYGYEFACAADIMRSYSGWKAADVTNFEVFMLNVFYPQNHDFLIRHNNTCDTHYWANWDLCNMTSIMAIGILCDDTNLYSEAVTYFKNGIGTGNVNKTLYYLHPGYLGQGQEEGRDQGHSGLDISLLGAICQMAWNQGDDLFGYENNRVLAICEYFAKYNLGHHVPYVPYNNCENNLQTMISASARGNIRPGWDLIYNHYVNVKGMAAPWTARYAALVRPEGGGGNYGSTSGGYDQLGFTTLTQTVDPIATNATPAPSDLMATVRGQQATVSWWGSAYASSYNVKRATIRGGPYTTVAKVIDNSYVDTGLTPGTTYYYVVSANNPSGESTNSAELAASPNDLVGGTPIGSAGSYNNDGFIGALVYDDSLATYYDASNGSGDWAGLDLGTGVSSVITKVEFCPRNGFASRMVGGRFQGANDPDFTNPVTLFTINTAPPNGILTSQTMHNGTAFRYVRYLGPANGWCNVAEVKFFGTTSGLTAPATPAGLALTEPDPTQINLSWHDSSGATRYCIKRATHSGGPYIIVGYTSETNFNDSIQADGATYHYVVSALDSAGESANATEVSVTPPTLLRGTIIGTPGSWDNLGNTITNVFDDNLNTYFDGPNSSNGNGCWAGLDFGVGTSNVISQINYCPRSDDPGRMVGGIFQGANTADFSDAVTLATVTTQPATDVFTSVAVASTNAFRYVRYLSPDGGWGNVAEVQFYALTPTNLPPQPPTGLKATPGDGQVMLAWNASGDATGYDVKRAASSGGNYESVGSVAGLSITNSGLTNGTLYYFVVAATNAAGESVNSTEVGARPTSSLPPNMNCGLSNGSLRFSWPADHTGWMLEAQTNSSGKGLTTNWFLINGSTITNQMFIPLDRGNDSGFFRLARP